MNEIVVTPSPMLGSLGEMQQVRLSEITPAQARAVVRRLLHEPAEAPKVKVAAFSSAV